MLGLALTTASCSQDDFDSTEATSEKLVEMSFIAGSSQPVTRTVLGSDGATVTWQTNDKIGIGFKGYQPKNYPFTTPTSGSDVRFLGTSTKSTEPIFYDVSLSAGCKDFSKQQHPSNIRIQLPKGTKMLLQAHLIQRRMYLLVSFQSVENHSLHTMLVVCSALPSKELQT